MKAMLLRGNANLSENTSPLSWVETSDPVILDNEILIKVSHCGVCHTELDEIEGRLPVHHFPMILGHQAIGTIDSGPQKGQRVGVAWIASTCGKCHHCKNGNENLCAEFVATGKDVHGGYAEYMIARSDFVHPIPQGLKDAEAAPLLCAGAIGYRALRLSGMEDGKHLGLLGFGASNHLVLKMARHMFPRSKIFIFSRTSESMKYAISLGATWAGPVEQNLLHGLDAIIDTTPAWGPIRKSLKMLLPGGRLVINAIRKEDSDKITMAGLDYPSELWMEKEIKSVANVTRKDIRDFLELADKANIKPEYQEYELPDANRALFDMKHGVGRGAKVLAMS